MREDLLLLGGYLTADEVLDHKAEDIAGREEDTRRPPRASGPGVRTDPMPGSSLRMLQRLVRPVPVHPPCNPQPSS